MLAAMRLIFALSLAASVSAAPPAARLFAVENWEKHNGGGTLPKIDWYSWRLAEVDLATGKLTGVTSWQGGTLPGGSNGNLVGAGWSTTTNARSELLVQESNKGKTLTCYDAAGHSCGSTATPLAEYMEENAGFFTYMSADDVQPYNSVFSLYDALTLDAPKRFATINNINTTGALWMTPNWMPHKWGANSVESVIYVAAEAFDAPTRLYRVQRSTGEVRELAFPPMQNSSMRMSALFVDPDPAASSEKLLVLLTAKIVPDGTGGYTPHSSTLYELDVATGATSVVIELPGVNVGPAAAHCRTFDKATRTLFLGDNGCETVIAVSLAERKIIGTTKVQTTWIPPLSVWLRGQYSMGGIVALSGLPEQMMMEVHV